MKNLLLALRTEYQRVPFERGALFFGNVDKKTELVHIWVSTQDGRTDPFYAREPQYELRCKPDGNFCLRQARGKKDACLKEVIALVSRVLGEDGQIVDLEGRENVFSWRPVESCVAQKIEKILLAPPPSVNDIAEQEIRGLFKAVFSRGIYYNDNHFSFVVEEGNEMGEERCLKREKDRDDAVLFIKYCPRNNALTVIAVESYYYDVWHRLSRILGQCLQLNSNTFRWIVPPAFFREATKNANALRSDASMARSPFFNDEGLIRSNPY